MSSRQRAQEARLRRLTQSAYLAADGVAGWDQQDAEGDGDADGGRGVAGASRLSRRHVRARPRRLDRRALVGVGVGLLALLAFVVVRGAAADTDIVIAPGVVGAGPGVATASPDDAGAEPSALPGPGGKASATEWPAPVSPEPSQVVLLVHVAGSVAVPGVVELSPNARVRDAVAAAGGASDSADLAAVNLARPVVDGEQVYVPAVGETPPAHLAPAPQPGGAGVGSGASPGLVNLNTATAAELDTLPGIGPALAERIIAWRTEHGGFRDVAELEEVSGIGPAVMSRIRDLVGV